jgi:DNA-binding NtrC family response regulator
MADANHVLVVDDDADVRGLLAAVLESDGGTKVTEAASGAEAMASLGREEFDVAVVDVQLPDHSGLEILRWARAAEVDTELIVLTGHADVETAVQAMRLGAYDFITKPCKNAELREVVNKAAEKKALRRENSALKEVITRRDGLPTIVGASAEIREVLAVIARVAASDSPVLVQGESGTGKELVARSIHLQSSRSTRPFVSINCGALPDTLLESELFGHKKGAFSGAINSRVGLFEAANGGTLFLDEIGEMSPAMQVRLLRVLDSGEVRRVGEERVFHVDVRVVAATAKDLAREAGDGRFRWDLFYRVSTIVIPVPPLRRRRADIPLLVEHFLAKHGPELGERGVAPEALDRLVGHDWPGNVRELENVIQRAMVMATSGVILPEHLPIGPVSAAASVAVDASLEEIIERKLLECVRGLREHASANLYDLMIGLVEKPLLRAVLRETSGNQVRAAQILGINRNTLRKKLTEHGIDPDTLEG